MSIPPRTLLLASLLPAVVRLVSAAPVVVDLADHRPDNGATVRWEADTLLVAWPISPSERGEIIFNLEAGRPLLEQIAVASANAGSVAVPVLQKVDPVTILTVGERDLQAPAGWMAFFDNPPSRAYRSFAAVLTKKTVKVISTSARTVVRLGEVNAGGFTGGLEFTLCRNSPLIFVEAVLKTSEDGRAILYDAGLVSSAPDWPALAWRDPSGALQRTLVAPSRVVAPLQVGGRVLVTEGRGDQGSLAIFPPPHQYFYPLDFADNLGFAWHGASGNSLFRGYGFGIQQPPAGDRRWVPWCNAPPNTEQRLGVFYLISSGTPLPALDTVAAYTRGDRYKKIPGYHTFTSHYHIEHTLEYLQAQKKQNVAGIPAGLETPGFVKTLKARGVDIVHLGEFHNGVTPRLAAKERLAQLQRLHAECARLSDDTLLVLPGEEPNVHLGGHWMSFFPKPVYWVLNRGVGQPLVEDVPGYGPVYQVGSADDVLRLMEKENGLMWTAHARIKGSRGFPDAYWDRPFYRSEHFLGAAWKAMPADLSRPRLGWRVLDLLDDMANAGLKKFVLAEADLFRMEPDYETYAHMNINYVRLAQRPRFGEGWSALLAALRAGDFFATTGEVLIPEFSVGGITSGGTLVNPSSEPMLHASIEWTFPLAFAEVVSGDGAQVFRQRIDLSDTESFGRRTLRIPWPRAGRNWVRLEVWDLARNGAFTQPIFFPREVARPD